MELQKAIDKLEITTAMKDVEGKWVNELNSEMAVAIDIVLKELNRLQKSEEDLMIKAGKIACEMSLKLDERYKKGYQDGFKQAKFDCEMDKLDGR